MEFSFASLLSFKSNFFCIASIQALTDEMGMLKLKANEN